MRNEKGQTLVVIFFIMIMALTIGISTSSRFIKGIRNITRTQTGYRSGAVAEAALERILLKPYEDLQNYIVFGNCGSECTLQITNSDGVVETANVTLTELGNSSEPFPLHLAVNQTSEINLLSYPNSTNVTVCWDNPTSGASPSVVGMLVYGSAGNYQAADFAYNSTGSSYNNNFSTTSPANGYQSCFNINSQTNPRIVRLRAMFQDLDVMVFPAPSTSIPTQGILIESVGTSLDTSFKVSAIKSANTVPFLFDYAIFSRSEVSPLAN